MTLCEELKSLRDFCGGSFELYISRGDECLPTYNCDCLCNTIDEWLEGFKQGTVFWTDSNDTDYEFGSPEYFEWATDLLFCDSELQEEEGPYEEPAYHWVIVDQ